MIFLATACASLLLWDGSCHAWTLQSARRIARASCWKKQPFSNLPTRLLEKQQSEEEDSSGKKKSTFTTTVLLEEQADAALLEDEDMEGPAIEGSQFFGGNKQKVEFYDPIAEATAGTEFLEAVASNRTLFNRFADRRAFETNKVADLAQQLQQRINQILYPDEQTDIQGALKYSSKLQWVTPLARKGNNDPLDELRSSRDFYRFVDLAITGGRSASNDRSGVSSFELRWELAVEWPTVWEPRILLTGTTMLDMSPSGNEIVRQVDALDHPSSDLFACIRDQILPRFWDVYHIGMTPSAELSPTIPEKTSSLLSNYRLSRLPPRWYIQATMLDLGSREDANAAMVPNHAFGCVIKTMGPQKQRFVPTSPTQVQINLLRETYNQQQQRQLQWLIPMSVEYIARKGQAMSLPIPDFYVEETDNPECEPQCSFVWNGERRIATVAYGGGPQDADITDVRKRLYDKVISDGLRPKLDASGRPCFLFFQHTVKTCFTPEGLGMAVYEWRPQFIKPNEVGIELEV